jgi:phenylacetate-CoA ligase
VRDTLLKQYHRLPPFLRSVAASARGGYLRAWRYGPRTDELRDEALERDRWTPEQWDRWTAQRLAFLLDRAATQVPYYREQWARRRRGGDRKSWQLLENWPLLEKETVRENPRAFVADDRSVTRMFHDHTSGTSGKSLDLWLSRKTVQAWYALFEARCRHWNEISRHDRWAIIGGQLVAPVQQDEPPFWVWNAPLHQLYLSAYHVAPRHVAVYVAALAKYEIRYFLGYPSAIHALAREILTQRLAAPKLQCVLTNAETLFEEQRRDISEAFSCPVRDTYGMAEIVANGSECIHGRMHLWPEAGVLELAGESEKAVAGRVGEFVCTGLLNSDMPLVRYRVGDRGVVAPSTTKCECGRALPILTSIEGRLDDVLYTSDGRTIGRLDPVFKSRLPIREAQIIQEALDQVRVRYVPGQGFTTGNAASIVDRIRDRMGAVQVVLEEVQAIPRPNNGKFRGVICNLSVEERERVQAVRARS